MALGGLELGDSLKMNYSMTTMDPLNITPTDYPDYETPNGLQPKFCNAFEVNAFGEKFLPPFYYIIFSASVLGNGLVLLVLFRFEKLLSVTNIFLFNLVFSNLVFTLTLPFQAVYHSSQWVFGVALCKIITCAESMGFYSSILFLTLMTLDRYLVVVHCVLANKWRRNWMALVLTGAIWMLSLLCSLETLLFYTVEVDQAEGLTCADTRGADWLRFTIYKQFLIFYIIPLIVFIFCYTEIIQTVLALRMVGKHRTVRLIFLIVLMFFLFWSPYNILMIVKEHRDGCHPSLEYAAYITGNIARFYFCINPLFYTFLGKKFQNHVREALARRVSCLSSRINLSYSTRSTA